MSIIFYKLFNKNYRMSGDIKTQGASPCVEREYGWENCP
jgi:hypothetical protein